MSTEKGKKRTLTRSESRIESSSQAGSSGGGYYLLIGAI
jgi:hypothetical protein